MIRMPVSYVYVAIGVISIAEGIVLLLAWANSIDPFLAFLLALAGPWIAAMFGTWCQDVMLPHPGDEYVSRHIDKALEEYSYPSNPKNAARAGYEAARRVARGDPHESGTDAR